MEKELHDNLKLVAEFMGWKESESTYWLDDNEEKRYTQLERLYYHDDWKQQIPVWAKLIKENLETFQGDEILEYYQTIDDDNPRAGFDIITAIIKRIKP